MSEKLKFYLTVVATAVGAVLAALPQLYPTGTAPDWVNVTMTIGGAIMAALGSLGISKGVLAARAETQRIQAEAEAEVLESLDPRKD